MSLKAHIAAQIAADGPMRIDAYMAEQKASKGPADT